MTSSDWLPTACILCECNCGIVVQVDDRDWPASGATRRIRGLRATPATRRCGWTITRTTGLA